jgi:hypothetical protein
LTEPRFAAIESYLFSGSIDDFLTQERCFMPELKFNDYDSFRRYRQTKEKTNNTLYFKEWTNIPSEKKLKDKMTALGKAGQAPVIVMTYTDTMKTEVVKGAKYTIAKVDKVEVKVGGVVQAL